MSQAAAEPSPPAVVVAPARHWGFVAFLVPCGALVWLALLSFPKFTFAISLETSWELALAHFLKHDFQAGTDYVFTYGPAGYFFSLLYDRDLYWLKYAWELAAKLVMATALVAAVGRHHGWVGCTACVALIVYFLGPEHRETRNGLYPLAMLALALPLCRRPRSVPLVAGAILALAAFALVKFTFLLLAAYCVAVLVASAALARDYRRAALTAAAFVGFWLAGWIALGQAPGHIPAYLRWSWEVTRGFGEGMAITGDPREIGVALGIIASMAAAVLCREWNGVPASERWAVLLTFAGAVFLQWKQGFTRHDFHSIAFFSFTLVAPFLLPAGPARGRTRRWAGYAFVGVGSVLSVVGLALAGIGLAPDALVMHVAERLAANARYAVAPTSFRDWLEQEQSGRLHEWDLPAIRARVGDAPVDLLTAMQGVVLVNRLDWRPRPVFQSYSAYTPALQELNATYLRSADAPEYVIVLLQWIDHRLPTEEDAPALLELLRRYEPVVAEKGCLLLRRLPDAGGTAEAAAATVFNADVALGQVVSTAELPGAYQRLSVRIEPTQWGRLRSLVYKPPPLFLEATTDQGKVHRFRLVPGMTAQGVLLNPYVAGTDDLVKLYAGSDLERIRSFAIVAGEGGRSCYARTARVRLAAVPRVVGRAIGRAEADRLLSELRQPRDQ